MAPLLPSQLLGEIEDAIRVASTSSDDPGFLPWVARAAMLLKRWSPKRSVIVDSHARGAVGTAAMFVNTDAQSLLMLLHEAQQDLRLNEVGPLSATVATGAVLDYFEEVRKVLVTAGKEVFFVDPYLDPEFVSRFMPQIRSGVAVRLLGKKGIAALLPAVDLAAQQFGQSIMVRSASSLHDRFVFVDGVRGFHSGAPFKDGARTAPTIFTEVTDTLNTLLAAYEQMWSGASVHR